MLANVQAMRGIAASMVLLGHLFPRLHFIGPTGVDIFFVISGFIITRTAHGDRLRFVWRRFKRIYPPYWLALGVAFLIDPYIPLAPDSTPAHHPLALILLTTNDNDKVAVAWTLAYEVYFYAVVALLWRPRWIAAWMAAQIIVVACVDPKLHWTVPCSPLILEFGLGCLVARFPGRLPAWPCLLAGLAWFAAGVHFNDDYYPLERLVCFGPASALLLYGLVALEGTARPPVILVRLGDISYPLYLWHQICFRVVSSLASSFH